MTDPRPPFAGLLLAAGAGRRLGGPKALLQMDGSPAAVTNVRRLRAAGSAQVLVVLGAGADRAGPLVEEEPGVDTVVGDDWTEGMGASLRTGLSKLAATAPSVLAVLVTLVDLPDVTAPVMERVVAAWVARGGSAEDLVRATYAGRPGHPVLIGRDHWAPLAASLEGDVGARSYLSERRVHEVTCEDLATGRDVDRPADLEPGS